MADPRIIPFALLSFAVLGGVVGHVYVVLDWRAGATVGFLIGCLYGIWYAKRETNY